MPTFVSFRFYSCLPHLSKHPISPSQGMFPFRGLRKARVNILDFFVRVRLCGVCVLTVTSPHYDYKRKFIRNTVFGAEIRKH